MQYSPLVMIIDDAAGGVSIVVVIISLRRPPGQNEAVRSVVPTGRVISSLYVTELAIGVVPSVVYLIIPYRPADRFILHISADVSAVIVTDGALTALNSEQPTNKRVIRNTKLYFFIIFSFC